MELNKIYNESNIETMAKMPDNFIDLTVTSPPYDGLRTYNGYSFPFEDIAKELFRVTKEGGVVVWVVGDATVKGSESGTSFKQALYFKEIGFNLHDTMIFKKHSVGACGSNYAYWQAFEYMFILTKGKIKTVNRIKDVLNKDFGKKRRKGKSHRSERDGIIIGEKSVRQNVWEYKTGITANEDINEHPAVFPEQLANDHIISWSNENDLVYDPFMGSGTTAKMCILSNRNWIGSELSSEYCNIIEERIKKAWEEKRKEKDLQA